MKNVIVMMTKRTGIAWRIRDAMNRSIKGEVPDCGIYGRIGTDGNQKVIGGGP
jgi:hypothetical protein